MVFRPRSFLFLVWLVSATGCAPRAAQQQTAVQPPAATPVTSGRELLVRMHERWQGRWLTSLSFLQNNTLYAASGGEQKTQWLEHLVVPGRLRIDYLPLSGHDGVLYEGGRAHVFANGQLTRSERDVNPLLLLGFDVYAQPVGASARVLDSLGFDLNVLHESQWQGRRAYVAGARAGDSTTNQFWVDAERLLFVRLIQRARTGTTVVDYHFNRYTEFEGIPVAVEVLMHRNGRLYFKEEYTNVRVNLPLADALFDPARWVAAQPTIR
jgi:hypothetical protein